MDRCASPPAPVSHSGLHRSVCLLAVAFALLALIRASGFWAYDPMLGYGNSYDQVRSLSALGLAPEGVSDRFQATPTAPRRWFVAVGGRHYNYPSSDILLSEIYYDVAKALSPSPRIDIKNKALFLLLLWTAASACCLGRLLKTGPWWALGYAVWLLIVADPINLLFLNTLYAEFTAFATLTVLVGIATIGLAQQRLERKSIWTALGLLLFLAANRQQYIFLPLVLIPAGWLFFPSFRTRPLVIAGMLVMALPMTLYNMPKTFDHLGPNGLANRMDTVMGALLPAASSSAEMLEHLDLPPTCAMLIGKDWYGVPLDTIRSNCPEVLTLPLSRYLVALAHDPWVLWRMGYQATRYLQGFMATGLGHVEGDTPRLLTDLPAATRPWTIDIPIRQCPPGLWLGLALVLTLTPLLLTPMGRRLHLKGWAAAMMTQTALMIYCLFTALLGDGYFDLGRHAHLCFSLGALSLVQLLAAIPLACRCLGLSTPNRRTLP